MIEGKVLGGRYQIQDKIGTGGMAAVFRGVDNVLGRTVAIKVMLPQYASDPTFAARFRQEAQAAAALSSPYIVGVYDWGQDGDTYYIVMEYIRGTDLKTGIRTHGALAPRKVAQIGAQVCAALSVAHRHEIIHRDIKPQNIMIQPDGTAKVMDFGIARAKNSHLTQTNSVLGTAHYVSPEQTQGKELGAESDLYSLGIVMYEAATGQVPFSGDEAITVALKQVNEEPVPPSAINPKIDPEFEAIILKCMQKRPENRFHSADELRRVLNNYIAGRPTGLALEPNLDTIGGSQTETRVMRPAADATRMMNNRPQPMTGMGGAAYSRELERLEPEVPEKKIWPIIVGAIAALVVVGIAIAMLLTSNKSDLKKIPNLVNMEQTQAVKLITDSGFTVGTISTEYNDTVKKGLVIDQDPDEGVEKKAGSTINLTLSNGPVPKKAVDVPNLKNKTAAEAEKALRDLGLIPAAGEAVHNSEVKAGLVVSQTPEAGSKAVEGDTVTYSISLGEENVQIPNVVGKSQDKAKSELESAGFTVSVNEASSNDVDAGKVMSQSPSGGGTAAKGSTITITVSKGPDMLTVPNVVGMGAADAKKKLTDAGFKVKIVEVLGAGSQRIVQQDIPGGQQAKAGSTITISLDSGGANPTPPGDEPGTGHGPGANNGQTGGNDTGNGGGTGGDLFPRP